MAINPALLHILQSIYPNTFEQFAQQQQYLDYASHIYNILTNVTVDPLTAADDQIAAAKAQEDQAELNQPYLDAGLDPPFSGALPIPRSSETPPPAPVTQSPGFIPAPPPVATPPPAPTIYVSPTVAHLAVVIWGSATSLQLQVQAQIDYVNAIASRLQAAGVDPLTASAAQISAAQSQEDQARQNAAFAAAGLPPPVSGAPPIPPTPAPPPAAPPPATLPVAQADTSPAFAPRSLYLDPSGNFGQYCDFNADDPYCTLAGDFGGWAGVIAGPTVQNNTTVVVQSGLLAADVHQIVNDALGGLWNAVVGTVDLVLGGIVAGIQTALTDIGNALKAAWNILSRLSGLILRFLQQMWVYVIAGLIRAVNTLATALKDLYDNVLKPVVGVLQQVRQKILDLWKRFIVPMLVVLQDIRRILTILSLFHIGFAQKLDAKLADMERRVTQPLFYLLSFTNGVANFINLIVTARYLLQKPLFLNSLGAYAGEALNLQLNAMTPAVTPAGIVAASQSNGLPTVAQSESDARTYLATGGGDYATLIEQQRAQLQTYLSQGV